MAKFILLQLMKRKEKTGNAAKPFVIDRRWVWEAYKAVKRNKGCAGVDKIDFKQFDKRMQDNLYKLWNRMSSGSYMPEPVLQVEIPKSNGGKRYLGIPIILDRIAQMTVVMQITLRLEAIFHQDSYGYRPAKSAHDAIKMAREAGFAEPDPRMDLNASDVIRKITILARESGYRVSQEDVETHLFIPDDYFKGPLDEFWKRIPELDG